MRSPRSAFCLRALLLAALFCIAGCGQKGDLYLPDKAAIELSLPDPSA